MPSGRIGASSKRYHIAHSDEDGTNGSQGAWPMAGRPSTCCQKANGSPISSAGTPGGGGSRNDTQNGGLETLGRRRSVNSNPGWSTPKTARVVWPTPSPPARAVARTCDIVRPRRSTSTSTATGPAGTWAANTVVSVRRCWSGRPSSAVMAAAATAAMTPPWGTVGQFQPLVDVDQVAPGRSGSGARRAIWSEKVGEPTPALLSEPALPRFISLPWSYNRPAELGRPG